jgi:molybdopterin/thiamine biosynthesis adenylyltransferase
MINEVVRYDRQKLIWGDEGQKRLENAVVTIIGCGNLAKYSAMPLCALGVGNIRIIGNSNMTADGKFVDNSPRLTDSYVLDQKKPQPHYSSSQFMCESLSLVNHNTNFAHLDIPLGNPLLQYALEGSDLIIDTTNSIESKRQVYAFVNKHKQIPYFSASVGESSASLHAHTSNKDIDELLDELVFMPHLIDQYQNPIISLMWGGVIAEEVKKQILEHDYTPLQSQHYHLSSVPQSRFSLHLDDSEETKMREGLPFSMSKKPLSTNFKDKNILVVGAGALGNIACLGLSEVDIGSVSYLDYDTIEDHNLNRQILFYDAVGLEKAEVLGRKHAMRNQATHTIAIKEKIGFENGDYTGIPQLVDGKRYDVIFDMVDNLYARAVLSSYCVAHDIPLISAGSSSSGSRVVTFAPNQTASLDEVFAGYYQKALVDEIDRRTSCIRAPDPSVIMTNQVAGALAVLEMIALFTPEISLFSGNLQYGSDLTPRLGETPLEPILSNDDRKKNLPSLEIKAEDLVLRKVGL